MAVKNLTLPSPNVPSQPTQDWVKSLGPSVYNQYMKQGGTFQPQQANASVNPGVVNPGVARTQSSQQSASSSAMNSSPSMSDMYQNALNQYSGLMNNNDYSGAYNLASQVANQKANQERTGYQNQLNLLDTNLQNSLHGVDTSMTNAKQDLSDRTFQNYLASRQNMANNGLSGTGLANDADTRVQLANNKSLAQLENNANQQRFDLQNTFNTQSQGIQNQINQINPALDTAQLFQQFRGQDAQLNTQKAQELMNYINSVRQQNQWQADYNQKIGLAQLDQQNKDRQYNLDMGKALGQIVPNGAQDLVSQVLQDKINWANADPSQQAVIAQDAANKRAQLSALGIPNVDQLFGANVPLAQAQQNASQAYIPTLEATKDKSDMMKNALDEAWKGAENLGVVTPGLSQLTGIKAGTPTFEAEKFYTQQTGYMPDGTTQTLDRQKYNLDSQKETDLTNYRNADLTLRQKQYQSNADYKKFLQDKGISDQNAQKSTNAAVATILGKYSTKDQALQAINDKADELANSGVDMREIMKAIEQKWPTNNNSSNNSGSLLNP